MKMKRCNILLASVALAAIAITSHANAALVESFDSLAGLQSNWDSVPAWMVEYGDFSGGVLTASPGQWQDAMMLSKSTFTEGLYTVKFKTTLAVNNVVYIGLATNSAGSVAAPFISTQLEGDRFWLLLKNGENTNFYGVGSPVVTANEWHTMGLKWQSNSIEMIYDGVSAGIITDSPALPTTALSAFIGVNRLTETAMTTQFDEVRVDSANPVPEPSSLLTLGMAGCGGLFAFLRRRSK